MKKINPTILAAIAGGYASVADMKDVGLDAVRVAKSADVNQVRSIVRASKSVGDRERSYVFSDESVDRMGDVILTSGWDLANFKQNPVVLWGHNASAPPIGTASKVKVVKVNGVRSLVGNIKFETAEANPDADLIFRMVESKTIRTGSVGFRPSEVRYGEEITEKERNKYGIGQYGALFIKQDLLEHSLVSIPANTNAVELGLKDLVSKGIITSARAATFLKIYPPNEAAALERVKASVRSFIDMGANLTLEDDDEGEVPETREMAQPVTRDFDVANQHIEAAKLEHDWVSRWCSCEVKQLHNLSKYVSALDAGSFFRGLESALGAFKVEDVRSITREGREVPPSYDQIQLTSTDHGDFLTRGISFMRGQTEIAVKVERIWGGNYMCSIWTKLAEAEVASGILQRAAEWAEENHFRKGQAFALTGKFIDRSSDGWDDVFLTDENKDLVQKAIGNINSNGADAPNRGMIWQGPPGTGKTLSARVLRNEAKATLIWCSTRDFMQTGGAEGIMAAFDMARRFAPAVILLEDVDAWLGRYVTDLLKTEMDGMSQSRGVTTILTTNHPESLPKALIDRPGRFHDVLTFDLPDDEARSAMFGKWLPELNGSPLTDALLFSDELSGAHVYELCEFAKSVMEQDSVDANEAMKRAIVKLQRQRELIGDHQKSFGQTAFGVPAEVLRSRPRGVTATQESLAFAAALTKLTTALTGNVEAQSDQIKSVRQLTDVVHDLARRGVSPEADPIAPVGQTDPEGSGDDATEELDVSRALEALDTIGRKLRGDTTTK